MPRHARHRAPCGALLALAALLGLAVSAGDALAAAEVYKPRHRTAAEMLPIAQAVLGSEGSAAVDAGTNSLVLVGPEPALARAVELLERQDVRLRNVLLRYGVRTAEELDAAGVAVRWSLDAGPARIGNVVRPVGDSGVDLRLRGEAASLRGQFDGSLQVLEGHTGRIETGTQVPYVVRGHHTSTTTFVNAASGFEVTPQVLGDGRVRLELRPFEAEPGPDGRIATAGAATTLVVSPGETVALGGIARSDDARSAGAGGGSDRRARSSERLLLISATAD